MAAQKLNGVNLGGWLVLEKWLTPSVFAGTSARDEWSLGAELGERRHAVLDAHRKTFITEADFAILANQHIQLIRIPVGYWLFEDAGPYPSAAAYVDWAVATAKKYGLRVLIDLHAAPGSQNGWDHSGRTGAIGWPRLRNQTETLDVLERIARRYGSQPTVWGLEVLNEPHWSIPKPVLAAFYDTAYTRIRQHAPDTAVVIHDSFRPHLWGDVLADKPQVVVDSHFYQCFSSEDKQLTFERHLAKTQEWAALIADMQNTHPVIVGEWSIALHSPTNDRQKSQYAQAQLAAFSAALSQCYWTYKKEQPDDWDYLNVIKKTPL